MSTSGEIKQIEPSEVICSECHSHFKIYKIAKTQTEISYCPHCGISFTRHDGLTFEIGDILYTFRDYSAGPILLAGSVDEITTQKDGTYVILRVFHPANLGRIAVNVELYEQKLFRNKQKALKILDELRRGHRE